MSIVMSTMAKQQSPGAIKLNAICEKLKRTSEEEGCDDDEMNEYELVGGDNNGTSGVFYPDRYCSNGSTSAERCATPQSTISVTYNEEDSNSNVEYGCYEGSGEASGYALSDDPGSPTMLDVESRGDEEPLVASGNQSVGVDEGGRRNKRKNFKPRNIVYQYESCEDAEGGEFHGEGSRPKKEFLHEQMYQQDKEQQRTEGVGDYDEEMLEQQEMDEEEDEDDDEDKEQRQRSHEQPLDLSGDPVSTADTTYISKKSLLPRRLDGAGTPMDLSYRHSDCSSSSCGSSDDGHNGFAIDLSKGSAAEWMMVDKDGVPVPESSSGPSSECPSPKTSSLEDSKVGLGSSSYSGTYGPRESPASSSRSALGTGDSSPSRPSPPLLPPHLTPMMGSSSTSTDASTLKDYAESTMKELLSLYGLNDMAAESITKNVPLDNFSSGKILETMTSRHPFSAVSPATAAMAGLRVTPPIPSSSSSSSTLPTRRSPSPTPPPTSHLPHPSTPPMHMNFPRTSDGVYSSICNKMVDSMAKLASLPPNSIIGNPRVILPPNMTSTILTLAAMQESKFAAMAAANNPSLTKTPSSEPVTSKSLIRPQSSVIVTSNNTCMNAIHPKDHLSKAGPIDYTRYVRRYSNAAECGSNYCKDLNYREHFHCMDCNSRVFVKKEEMIRHFKWHKKRDESLQHGFLRFSPMDDCSDRFHNCSHNRKQTHYHCLKESCDKVYISTSDVQMHANYHRKDSAIIQEGFQRFRATEDCAIPTCSFYGQRTTHFHCRRANCNYTFKNKADMEKHKTYHIKDEQLNKDGFKKFMKHEHCSFENCRFSRVCNHIHCIRAGCTYVLHSSGQLYSHKRKHERRENEMAYRKFKLAQSMLKTFSENHTFGIPGSIPEEGNSSESTSSSVTNAVPVIQNSLSVSTATTGSGGLVTSSAAAGISSLTTTPAPSYNINNHHHNFNYPSFDSQSLNQLAHFFTGGVNFANPLGLPIPLLPCGGKPGESFLPSTSLGVPTTTLSSADHLSAIDLTSELLKPKPDDSWKRYLTRYTANDPCKPNCDFLYKDHYHCKAESCTMMFRSKDGVREHARSHEQQDQVTEAFFTTVEAGQTNQCPTDCPYQSHEKHYHCCWESCREIILPSDKAFRRLDHYKMHDYSRKSSIGKDHLNMTLATSLDGMFKRKRGRPPKNRIIEFPVTSGHSEHPQAIFTSFKLPKPSPSLGLSTTIPSTLPPPLPDTPITAVATPFGFIPAALLHRPILPTSSATTVATSALSAPLVAHTASPIEAKVEVQEGFYIFPKNTSCPDQFCLYSRQLHYHCTQPRCFYVTNRIDILTLHSRDFHGNVEILADFAYYDRDVDCHLSSCTSNRVNRHYHCTKPNCNFSFVRYSMMAIHDQSHRESETKPPVSPTLLPSSPPPPTLPPLRPIIPPESPSCSDSLSPPTLSESVAFKNTVVKATGTFYPLSAFPQHNQKRRISQESSNQSYGDEVLPCTNELPSPSKDGDHSLSRLLMLPVSGMMQPFDWSSLLESHVQFDQLRPCGQSFCKLKKVEHYHCSICNQALSGFSRLQSHVQKHALPPSGSPASSLHTEHPAAMGNDQDGNNDDSDDHPEDEISDENIGSQRSSLPPTSESMKGLTATAFATAISENPSIYFTPAAQALAGYPSLLTHPQALSSMDDRLTSPRQNGNNETVSLEHSFAESSPYLNSTSASPSHEENVDSMPNSPHWLNATRKRNSSPRSEEFIGVDGSKRCRVSASLTSLRILKDEPVPEGYIRYRFNEDCRYQHCGYREHQTHFHCIRRDCGYSFCDKTRFVQHTARHERLDTLMGGDFQQFRANVACGRPDCLYTITMSSAPGTPGNKASHFHCLKCEFVCTDTNKVVAHRRQHQKLDSIMAAGFEKFTPTQNCNIEACTHNQKQTHYHCMKCQYAVLGLSQMSAHKYRHLE